MSIEYNVVKIPQQHKSGLTKIWTTVTPQTICQKQYLSWKMYNSPVEYTSTKFKSDNKLSIVPKNCSVTIQVNWFTALPVKLWQNVCMNTQHYSELSSSRPRMLPYPELASDKSCYNIYPEITSGRTAVVNSPVQIFSVYS